METEKKRETVTRQIVKLRSIVSGEPMGAGADVLNHAAEDLKLEKGILNKQLSMEVWNVKEHQRIYEHVTNIPAQLIAAGAPITPGLSAQKHVAEELNRVLEKSNKKHKMVEYHVSETPKELPLVIKKAAQLIVNGVNSVNGEVAVKRVMWVYEHELEK